MESRKIEGKKLYIIYHGGPSFTWYPGEYTDYKITDDAIIVLDGEQWIGFYPRRNILGFEARYEEDN